MVLTMFFKVFGIPQAYSESMQDPPSLSSIFPSPSFSLLPTFSSSPFYLPPQVLRLEFAYYAHLAGTALQHKTQKEPASSSTPKMVLS